MASRDDSSTGEPGRSAGEDALANTARSPAAARADGEALGSQTELREPDAGEAPAVAADRPARGSERLARGSILGRYTIVDVLGEGGMGVVYAAYDPDLDRKVALKLLRGSAGDGSTPVQARARLLREARAMAKLRHPNVITVYEVGRVDDTDFVAMELVDGPTLAGWIKEPHHWHEVVDVFVQAGRGLAAAHQAGLVHRDFKPANVLLSRDGVPLVTDFGLARSRPGDRAAALAETVPGTGATGAAGTSNPLSTLTRTGALIGTPAYMAPEQHLGRATDERCDQFSFCVALFEALFGRRPFEGGSLPALREAITSGRIAEPPRGRKLPAAVRRAVERGLRPEPAERHPSMRALLSELVRARRRPARRAWFAVIGVAVISTAAALTLAFARRSSPSAGPAVCRDGATDLRGVWDDSAKAAVRGAFVKADSVGGRPTYSSVAGILDAYAAAWRQAYAGTCQATYATHKQSEEDFYLSRQCLLRRRRALAALVGVFRRADEHTVRGAVEAAEELRSSAGCLDVKALRAGVPPPKDPKTREAVAGLRAKLADIDALLEARKISESRKLVHDAVAQARALHYKPVLGEALLRLGRLDRGSDNADGARKAFKEAEYVADVAGDGALRARALVEEVKTETNFSSDSNATLKLAVRAQAEVRRHSRDPALAIELSQAMATLYMRPPSQDLHKADALLSRALATAREELGPEDTRVADIIYDISKLRVKQRRLRAALALAKQALSIDKKRLGAGHPDVAVATDRVAFAQQLQGRYDDARALYRQTARFWEKTRVGRELVELGRQAFSEREVGPRLCGRVVDGGGRPVAGAEVVVGPSVRGDGKFAGGFSAGFVERFEGVRRAVTGMDGRFVVDRVPKGRVVAVAEKGSVGRSWPVVLATAESRAAVLLRLRPYGSVRGHIDDTGAPPAALWVRAVPRFAPAVAGEALYSAVVFAGRGGRFSFERLAAGHYRIEARANRRFDQELVGREVDVAPGKQQTVDLGLPGGPKLTVTVNGPEGQDVVGAPVMLVSAAGPLRTWGAVARALFRSVGTRYEAVSLYGTPAVFSGVAPGRYRMCFLASSRDPRELEVPGRFLDPFVSLPANCRAIEVAPTPTEQTLTVTAHHLVDPLAAASHDHRDRDRSSAPSKR